MRYYVGLDFLYWFSALALGLVAVIVIYVIWFGYRTRLIERLEDPYDYSRTDVPGSEESPVVPSLLLIYIGVVLWVVGYIVIIGFFGGPII
jgi:small-conductance mechanosensitive channel